MCQIRQRRQARGKNRGCAAIFLILKCQIWQNRNGNVKYGGGAGQSLQNIEFTMIISASSVKLGGGARHLVKMVYAPLNNINISKNASISMPTKYLKGWFR